MPDAQVRSQAARPLSIAIVGAGKIGSTFAYKLACAGHDVTAIARPASTRLEQLQRDGGIVLRTGERACVRIADMLDEAQPYDLVIVTTLAHQAESLLPSLQRSASLRIHFMFVTFTPERFLAAIGTQRCTFGMPFVMAMLDADGKLAPTIRPGQKTLHGDRRWTELFAGAGIPSLFEPDMPRWLRCHAPLTVAFESVCVAGQRRGGGASWAEAMVVARGVRGGFAIVKGLGYRLYPQSKAVIGALPVGVLAAMLWGASRAPSFRDLLATGLYECRALADAIAAAADDVKPPISAAAKTVLAAKPAADAG